MPGVASVWAAKPATRLFPIRRTALVRCRVRPPPEARGHLVELTQVPGGELNGHGGEVSGETFGFVCARRCPRCSVDADVAELVAMAGSRWSKNCELPVSMATMRCMSSSLITQGPPPGATTSPTPSTGASSALTEFAFRAQPSPLFLSGTGVVVIAQPVG